MNTRPEKVSKEYLAEDSKLFSSDRAFTTVLSDHSTITVLAPSRDATYAEWFSEVLGVSPDTLITSMALLLIKHGYLVNPAQKEEIQERTDAGENTGMCTNEWGNYFPRTSGNTVSIGCMSKDALGWRDSGFRIAAPPKWSYHERLLLSNFDSSKLGL